MKLKLKLQLHHLVVFTCFSLIGIIALQVFWLYRAFNENRDHVLGLVNNTIIETQLMNGVQSQYKISATLDGDKASTTMQDEIATFSANINSNLEVGRSKEHDSSNSTLKIQTKDSVIDVKAKSFTLDEYKEILSAAFKAKDIDLPFALALVSDAGDITACTTDPKDFNVQSMKSSLDNMMYVYLNSKQEGKMQVAFYNSNLYFIKKLSGILFLSLGITSIGILSFASMIGMFYKNKRISEMKNDFMNNMTHELKTPISSVSLAIELLKDQSGDVPALANSEYFSIANSELERLSLLVDRVLKMAAFEKMEVKIVKTAFIVKDWIEKVLQSIKPLANADSAVFEYEVYPAELMLYGDAFHLTNALQNLLENAIKYADKNKSILKVMVLAWEDPDFFYLQVVDNGIGIKIQDQDKIFDKFFRSSYGDNHETKGYGLGLSYVKEIVNLHNGVIEVGSILKVGTNFKIKIPK